MKRKLVKQGTATMMISLPSKWIKENKLEKGSEVDLTEQGHELVISSDNISSEKNNASIDISSLSPLVNRIIISYYVKGIDELEIKFSKREEVKDFANRIIHELIGFEIIKQTQNSLIIKDITGLEKQDVDSLIRRTFSIVSSMFEELVQAIEKKQDFEPVIELDFNVNKFVHFCLRVLNKKGYKDNKILPVSEIVSSLEELGDNLKKIAKNLDGKEKINSEQLKTVKEIHKSFILFEKLFFEFSKEDIVIFAKRYESIKKEIKNKNNTDFQLYDLNEILIKMNNPLMTISFN